MLRRVTGAMLLVIGLAGLGLAGFVYTQVDPVVDTISGSMTTTLGLTATSLETVEDTLMLAQGTIGDVNTGLETVGESAATLAETLEETQPLLEEVTQIASVDAPDSIEAVQDAIPDVAEVAGVIDDTLVTLNSFAIDENILGFPIQYSLGIDYNPSQPFDQTVNELGDSLEGLPEQLRALEPSLVVANENLGAVSEDISAIAGNLETINGRIAEIDPLLTQYITIVQDIDETVTQTQTTIDLQLESVKLALKAIVIWLGLMQFTMLYLGWDLMTRLNARQVEEMVEEKIEEEIGE